MSEEMLIKFEGEALVQGRIPVDVLAKSLTSVQTAIFAIGEYEQIDRDSFRERGPIPKKVKEHYTLELIGTEKGSFVVKLDLPEVVEDLVQSKTFNLFQNVMAAVGNEDTEQLLEILPDRGTRNRIIKSVIQMVPVGNDYSISFKQKSTSYTTPITAKVKQSMSRLLSKPLEGVREVVGRIVELKIIGDSYIGVNHNSKIVKCTSLDLDNEAYRSIGKEVILKGEALLTNAGEIKELVSISDVFIAEPGKLPLETFVYNNMEYEMCDGFFLDLDYSDDYWIIEHESLGIYVSELKLSDALEACYAEIEFLVEEYMDSSNEELTQDAIELKEKIIRFVESVVALH